MKNKTLRFKVFRKGHTNALIRVETTQEVYDFLKDQTDILELTVECIIDDIEVSAIDFLTAWDEGERPGDLQMF